MGYTSESYALSGVPIAPMTAGTADQIAKIKETHAKAKLAAMEKKQRDRLKQADLAQQAAVKLSNQQMAALGMLMTPPAATANTHATGPTGPLGHPGPTGPTGVTPGSTGGRKDMGDAIPTHGALGDYQGDIPDLLEPVVGYRAWTVNDDGTLTSYNGTSWLPREAHQASCKAGGGEDKHRAPDLRCTCGMYAAKEPEDMQFTAGGKFVWGRTALWGRVVEHAKGYRAEWAYPIALNLVNGGTNAEDVAALLSARYGCPVRIGGMAELYEEHRRTWDKKGLPPQVVDIIG